MRRLELNPSEIEMESCRITKYDPRHRDASGAYRRDEWTSHSDIGRSYGGQVVTRESYLAVENAYVGAVIDALREAGQTHLEVSGLELGPLDWDEMASGDEWPHGGLMTPGWVLRDGDRLDLDAVARVSRLILREACWCRLSSSSGFHVWFGFDYYMYIVSPTPIPGALAQATAAGLFVEHHELPPDHSDD